MQLHTSHHNIEENKYIRFEVFMAVTMKNAVFLRNVLRLLVTPNAVPCLPDDGGDKFLRKVGSYKSHIA
jgi:hypothetical protein